MAWVVAAVGLCLGLVASIAALAQAATPPPLRAAHAAVASDHPLASAAGLALLKAGGNAVDAACATALALGVVHPDASGIGGGGFALVYLAASKQTVALDFRERAPAGITPAAYFKDGKVDPELSKHGGLAVAVPGEVRGLAEMVKRWGKLPFSRCVDGAHRLAQRGFQVSWRLAADLGYIDRKAPAGNAPFIAQFATAARRGGYFPPARPGLDAVAAARRGR